MTLLLFLAQPYPRNESVGHSVRTATLIGVFVGTFLLLFQPFNLNSWDTPDKALKIVGFGLVTTVVLLVDMLLLPRLFPSFFREQHWTVGREIGFILWHMALITVANRMYMYWLLGDNGPINWWFALAATYLIGLFPTVGAVTLNYIVQLRRYTRQAGTLSAHWPPTPVVTDVVTGTSPTPTNVTLVADNEKDAITVASTDLLAIESSDNYCTVFQRQNGAVRKELLRSSLSRLAGQLAVQSPGTFLRCHRSYVVNNEAIERVSGNAQGYKLHLAGGQVIVPVGRKYKDLLPVRP